MTIRRMEQERKRSRGKGRPLGGTSVEGVSLGGIFLGEGHLAFLSTGVAGRSKGSCV